jgi:hypothetical protein
MFEVVAVNVAVIPRAAQETDGGVVTIYRTHIFVYPPTTPGTESFRKKISQKKAGSVMSALSRKRDREKTETRFLSRLITLLLSRVSEIAPGEALCEPHAVLGRRLARGGQARDGWNDDRFGALLLGVRELQEGGKMGDAVYFRKAFDKAREKHRPSWLYHLAVPLAPLIGLSTSTALGQGKVDQLFAAIFFLTLAVWAISDSHIFGLAVDSAASLDAIEQTVDALQSEISSLKSEMADLPAKTDD